MIASTNITIGIIITAAMAIGPVTVFGMRPAKNG
jgi:hypothetical protein